MKINIVELSVSALALVVASWALYVSIVSNNATIRHNELSVTPILQMGHTVRPSESDVLNFRIKNVGLGPAIIKEIEFSYGGTYLATTSSIELKGIVPNLPTRMHTKSLEPGQVLPAGQTYFLFKAVDKGEVSVNSTIRAREFFEKFCLDIKYMSVYEKMYTVKSVGCKNA